MVSTCSIAHEYMYLMLNNLTEKRIALIRMLYLPHDDRWGERIIVGSHGNWHMPWASPHISICYIDGSGMAIGKTCPWNSAQHCKRGWSEWCSSNVNACWTETARDPASLWGICVMGDWQAMVRTKEMEKKTWI
jgi:hypothetical protein